MKLLFKFILKTLFLFLLIGVSLNTFSQNQSLEITRNDSIQPPAFNSGNRNQFGNYVVKLSFHNLRKSDGTGGFSWFDLIDTFQDINSTFSPYGICFVLSEIEDIDEDNLYNYYRDVNVPDPVDWFHNYTTSGTINIFFSSVKRSSLANAMPFGYVSNGIWVQTQTTGTTDFKKSIIKCLGQCFGLYETENGQYCNSSSSTCCPELVNGTNSSLCGDFVSDTPADPDLQGNVDNVTCNYTGVDHDQNGDTYSPLTNNYMSFAPDNCKNSFTDGQIYRMKYYLENIFLPSGYLVAEDITVSHNFINETGNRFVTSLNNLEVGNSTIENSTVHYVAQNSITFKDGFHVKSGSHVKAYIDNICPFSPHLRMSNQTKQLRHEAIFVNNLFQIAENNSLQTVKVENSEPEFISKKIEAFPNPFSNLLSLNFLNFEPNCPVKLSISDISGKIIFSESFNLESVKKSLDLQYVKDGIYMISISSGDCFIQNFRIVKVPHK